MPTVVLAALLTILSVIFWAKALYEKKPDLANEVELQKTKIITRRDSNPSSATQPGVYRNTLYKDGRSETEIWVPYINKYGKPDLMRQAIQFDRWKE